MHCAIMRQTMFSFSSRVEIVSWLLLVIWTSLTQSDIIRSSCVHNARFENPKKGFSLPNHVILTTVDVKSASDCVIECLQHPSCKSINFKDSKNSVCELNDKTENEDSLISNEVFTYYGPTEASKLDCSTGGPGDCKYGGKCLPPSCVSDKMVCECQDDRIGPTCEELPPEIAQHVDLAFPRASIEDYVLVNNEEEIESFSVVFWANIVVPTLVTPLSYAVDGSNQELVITMVKEILTVTIQTIYSKTFYIPPINDGFWHHIGILWSNKIYTIFVDGTSIYTGKDFGSATPLKGGGSFAIGQTMIAPGKNFNPSASFVGKLSQLNIWNRVLTTQEVKGMSDSCSNNVGSIVDWIKVVTAIEGELLTILPQECKSLRNDENYDIAISASSQTTTVPTYVIMPDSFPSITAFTIVMWVKHTTIFPYFKYIVGTENIITFRINKGSMLLKIMGSIKRARIPMYWNEHPSYWHHIGTTWSGSSGIWQIFLDGSLVSAMTGAITGVETPSDGTLVFGNSHTTAGSGMSVNESIDGSVSRVNIWDYVIDGGAIWAMAKGPLFENGNVFAWYGVKSKSVGDMTFEATPITLNNTRKEAEFIMMFPRKSTLDYAVIDDPFKEDLTTISACFWLRVFTTTAAIFAYSTTQEPDEFMAYMKDNQLSVNVHAYIADWLPMITRTCWHVYCLQWQSSDGLVEYYRDGVKVLDGIVGKDLVIRRGGAMIIGQEPDGHVTGFQEWQALEGHIMQLNFWREFLQADEIQGMASGVINVNGNLLQWRDLRNHVFGNIKIKDGDMYPIILEQPVQKKRDIWCVNEVGLPEYHYARYSEGKDNCKKWRCFRSDALLPENVCYNILLQSRFYYTKPGLSTVWTLATKTKFVQ